MKIQGARDRFEVLSPEVKANIALTINMLPAMASEKLDKRCAVCDTNLEANLVQFVIPLSYIASCRVLNNLVDHCAELPLRYAYLCRDHKNTFDALFIDPADPHWDVARLDARAEALGGIMAGSLLVFGGEKALKVAREFQAAIVALKESR